VWHCILLNVKMKCSHVVVFALLSLVEATLLSQPKLTPPLKDVKSDKKFFGPAGDYADDKRPVVDQKIMDKLKGPEQPYPSLQSKDTFDSDYVKDENSDKGAWQAQFEYDSLRRKLQQEEGDEKTAEGRANQEGRDVDKAQHDDDDANGKVKDAQKGVDDASKGENDEEKTADDFSGAPSDEKLKELKKAVEAAEAKYEQQKKAFEECERQLEAAKKELADLKAKQAALEAQLGSETKLWVENNQKLAAKEAAEKTVKLTLKKTKEQAHLSKTLAVQQVLAAAEKIKVAAEKVLAEQKVQSATAQKKLQKEKADLTKARKDLAEAATRLQNLHKPAEAAPTKSWFTGLFR